VDLSFLAGPGTDRSWSFVFGRLFVSVPAFSSSAVVAPVGLYPTVCPVSICQIAVWESGVSICAGSGTLGFDLRRIHSSTCTLQCGNPLFSVRCTCTVHAHSPIHSSGCARVHSETHSQATVQRSTSAHALFRVAIHSSVCDRTCVSYMCPTSTLPHALFSVAIRGRGLLGCCLSLAWVLLAARPLFRMR
jgi:hypothetical protein